MRVARHDNWKLFFDRNLPRSARQHDTGDTAVLRKVHAVQMDALMRLLRLDEAGNGASLIDDLNAKSPLSASGRLDGHMVEIPTGQGKSIVLGIFACILVLQVRSKLSLLVVLIVTGTVLNHNAPGKGS